MRCSRHLESEAGEGLFAGAAGPEPCWPGAGARHFSASSEGGIVVSREIRSSGKTETVFAAPLLLG